MQGKFFKRLALLEACSREYSRSEVLIASVFPGNTAFTFGRYELLRTKKSLAVHCLISLHTSTPFDPSSLNHPAMDSGPSEPWHWHHGNRTYSIKVSDTGVAGLQGEALDMSSLSRRACYKCGNVGHYAGQRDPSDQA